MAKRTSKKQSIMDAAERMTRAGGYHDVSFRRIADDVGIKSASVFHHFSSKEDLGAAITRRYSDRFFETIGDPHDKTRSQKEKLACFREAYRRALKVDRQMCLCGMLGAEISSLPGDVADEARLFFKLNIDWLEAVLMPPPSKSSKSSGAQARAAMILSALSGALMISRATGNTSVFDKVADQLSI